MTKWNITWSIHNGYQSTIVLLNFTLSYRIVIYIICHFLSTITLAMYEDIYIHLYKDETASYLWSRDVVRRLLLGGGRISVASEIYMKINSTFNITYWRRLKIGKKITVLYFNSCWFQLGIWHSKMHLYLKTHSGARKRDIWDLPISNMSEWLLFNANSAIFQPYHG